MTFNDDDLKRLKDGLLDENFEITMDTDIPALLARLEAAERVCNYIESRSHEYISIHEVEKQMEIWLKAAGK